MKKIVLTSVAAASFAFAATDAQVVEFYSGMVSEGIKVSVVERKPMLDGIEAVIVKLSNGTNSQNEVIFTKGDLLFPDVVDLNARKSYLAEVKQKMMSDAISGVYKAEDKANIISIGNDSKKPTIVVFSDPECPYCRSELDKIETTLKTSNVNIILTPVHDKSALQKSALIYKETASAKSDSEKIKALRKYFADGYNVQDGAVSDDEVKKMDALRQKYFAAGIRSVPTILDLADLQK